MLYENIIDWEKVFAAFQDALDNTLNKIGILGKLQCDERCLWKHRKCLFIELWYVSGKKQKWVLFCLFSTLNWEFKALY